METRQIRVTRDNYLEVSQEVNRADFELLQWLEEAERAGQELIIQAVVMPVETNAFGMTVPKKEHS